MFSNHMLHQHICVVLLRVLCLTCPSLKELKIQCLSLSAGCDMCADNRNGECPMHGPLHSLRRLVGTSSSAAPVTLPDVPDWLRDLPREVRRLRLSALLSARPFRGSYTVSDVVRKHQRTIFLYFTTESLSHAVQSQIMVEEKYVCLYCNYNISSVISEFFYLSFFFFGHFRQVKNSQYFIIYVESPCQFNPNAEEAS